jgi:acetylornithine deacetylase/succinyl-diaminopimelate desuccinylase-like protein
MSLQAEAVDVLSTLIRFNTVNPPGNEREAAQWLAAYLRDAGLETEMAGAEPERPNLVATLSGEADGPVLGYLGHLDTVLADPADWTHDPWGAEIVDGVLYGRGAVDMKNQVAAEAVALAHLARNGWRPPRGTVKLFAVADEEVGSKLGAKWLVENRPDLARVDYLLNEGGGGHFAHGGRRHYGVGVAEKGTFRFRVTGRGTAGHASVPGVADNALLKLAPVLARMAGASAAYEVTEEPRALLRALGEDPDDPAGALRRLAQEDPRLAAMVQPIMQITLAPTRISASEKINVIPARAELEVDCRAPAGMVREQVVARVREVLGEEPEIEFFDEVVGNRSPASTPLMDAIGRWLGDADPGAATVPWVLPAFTDSRWWRDTFPDCVAYGFFPMRRTDVFGWWPLLHAADERIHVDDLGYATEFFAWLPRTLLT